MAPRTIGMKLATDVTYRNQYDSSYSTQLVNDFAPVEYAFSNVWNVTFSKTNFSSSHLPNRLCTTSAFDQPCNLQTCGSDCNNHYKGWNLCKNALVTHYPASGNLWSIGVVGTYV